MKQKIIEKLRLPGKLLLTFATLFVFSFGNIGVAQTSCVKADFEYSIDHSTKTVKFAAKASSNAILFVWDFGSGSTVKGSTTTKTYSAAGDYKVCLTVYGYDSAHSKRCSVTVCKRIEIKKCDLRADFSLRTDGLVIKAEAKSSSSNAVYGWTFGDGNTERGDEVKHRYAKDGKYTICLFVKDTVTGCTTKICKDVALRKCDLKADFDLRSDGLTIKAEAKSSSNHVVYGWTFGDGDSERGREVKHTYAKDGKYSICLFVKDTVTGCTAKICKDVALRDCDIKVDFDFKQHGNDFKFEAKSNEANAVFIWSFGDGEDGKGSTIRHSYDKPGVYKVCVTAILTNSTGTARCTATVCKRVEVKREKDTCDLRADFKYEIDGKKIVVKGHANEDSVLYFWSWGDGTSSTGQFAKHKYAKYGVYEVCLVVFNPKTHCKTCVCKKIVIEKPCNLRANFKYRVDGNKVIFRARSNSSSVEYGWKFGDGDDARGNPVRHQYAKPGTYKVTLIVYDKRTGCKLEIVKRIIINRNSTAIIDMEEEADVDATSDIRVEAPDYDWTATAFPVPSNNQVTFTSDQKILTHAIIYSQDGVKVLDTSLDVNQQEEVDITILPTGFYYAHLTASDGTVKIVKFLKN